MKNRYTALLLALLILVQVFAPEVARAKASEPSKQTTVQLVKMGALDPKTYPKLDNKTILAIQKQARENQKRTKRAPGAGLFSANSPYLPGQTPTDKEKAATYGKLKVKFKTFGLKENGTEKEFQWNEIFGTDSNGNSGTANIYFVQRDAETREEKHRFKLTVDKAGDYTLEDIYGNPALLPLYSTDLKPYKYDVELDTGVSEKITLLTVKLSYSGNEVASFVKDSDGKIVATIPMDLQIAQTASTKFVSEWHTDALENDRPAVNGDFDTHEGQDLRYFPFPKNNTDVLKLRMESYNLETDDYPGYDPQTPPHLRVVPEVNVEEDMLDDPATYTIDKDAKRITANGKTYKYRLDYDVIKGGKLTMTEILPVTFDANGGTFASITDSTAKQEIKKEVDYDGTLTEKAEEPTKDRETFKGWGIKVGENIVAAKDADFAKIKSAKTFYAIWESKEFTAEGLTVHESYKEGNTYVNDFIPTLDKLKEKVKVDEKALADQDTLAIVDDGDQVLTDAEAIKNYLYKKLREDPATEISRDIKIKGQVTDSENKTHDVTIPIKVIKNIYEAKTKEGKPVYVPKEYVKVTVDPTTKATDPQKYTYFVNPKANVVIPGKDPTGTGDNKFVKWTMKADTATGDGAEYKLADKPRQMFTEASTITAQYVSDVIPANDDGSKPDTVPANFVEVKFVPTDKATDETKAEKIFWVNPEKEVTIPVKNPVGKQYFTFKEWKMGANADGATYTPSTAQKFTEPTTVITATYDEAKNIIPYNPEEAITRPDGYVRVTFAAETGLKLTEQKAYYVKQNAKDEHGTALTLASLAKPTYEAQTGYKFDKWDKEDTTVIGTGDIVVTAKATKLDTVIPEKDKNGNDNEKPKGYKEVIFKIKDDDKTKGSIDGVAKFYVNPTEYVTINPPTTKAETGFEFGAWDKDATIPTVYDKDTTITGSFNELKAVIPNKNPDGTENKQPDGYKKVTFVIAPARGGKIVDGEVTVYYVNPAKDVTVPQPKTTAETGFEFEEWRPDTTTTAKKYTADTEVRGSFRSLSDFIPSTDDKNNPNPKPAGYVTVTFDKGEHGAKIEGKTVYYVNPNAGVQLQNLTFESYNRKNRPVVTPEVGFKYIQWDKTNNTKIDKDLTVTALYQKLPDVVPKTKDDETEKPNGYIAVKFSTEANGKIIGTNKTEKVVYVNKNKAVALDKFAPTVDPNTGFDFAGWDTQIVKKIQYSDGDTIKALYNAKDDVIPQKNTDGSDKPAGYLTVTFAKGDHGDLSGKTVYYVKPNKEVTVPAPDVKPNVGYEFDKWDSELTKTFTKDTTITAQYKPLNDVIPQEKTDGSDKPKGYVTVKFVGKNGTLEGTTVYYVNPDKTVDLAENVKALTKTPDFGYTEVGGTWNSTEFKKQFSEKETTYTFTFKELDNVIPEKNDDGSKNAQPKGYVKVTLIPTDKATDDTKENKVFFVNPKEKVTIPSTNPVGKEITDANKNTYTFTFKEWTSTRGVHGTWNPSTKITGTFTQDTDIKAKYNVKAENLVNGPIPKKDVVTPKGDVPEAKDLIKNIPGSENHPLPEGTKITYTDDGTPDVKNPGDSTAKVKIEYPNGKTVVVEVPVKVVDNVVPQMGNEKPKVPDSYVKVTVDTTNKATNNTMFKKVFWVKPGVEVTIPGINDPTGKPETDAKGVTTTNNFDKWQQKDGATKSYTDEIKDSFTGDTIIIATYTVKDNVPPQGKDNPWIPQNSRPSPKDFINNPYDDGHPNDPNNLPPGTKLEFVPGKEPKTDQPGNGETTIKITYPNGEEKEVPVKYRVTGDVVEQTDPKKKPDVPDDFVEVIVKTTDKATDKTFFEKKFWVNPNKIVTIGVQNPTGKNLDVKRYEFTGWDHPLRDQFTTRTIITAKYQEFAYDPSVRGGVVETQIGKQPTKEDYAKQINANGERFKVTDIVKKPDVSKSGMSEAEVEIQFENGVKKTVRVMVYVIPDPKIIDRPVPTPGGDQPNLGKGALNDTDHYQYLIGYPDGNFAPNKGMTRAEVATMFTRLLKERPVKWKHYNAGLSDIRPGDWYADTVGYAVQKGIVSGYPDGSFKPNKPITRAEFASIASRFDALAQGQAIAFSDLAPSHWGYNAIRSAASKGWISGYPDNTFRPEKAITRAEVTSVTNRMLNRYADLYWIDAHRAEIIRFGDVKRSDWYFEPIMEATMGHDFIRDRDGKTEHWTGVNGKSFI